MKLNRIILLLTAITLMAIIGSGLLFYFNLHNSAVSETHLAAEINIKKLAEKLDTVITEHHQTIRAIAGVWEIKKAVRETEKDLLEFANEALKHFQTSLNGEVLYLMDKDGTVRASSNYDEAGSFVGKNYAFRPYFKEAIRGGFGAYPALGVTTNKRGLYLSCPVYPDGNGVVGGVLVFKITPDHFQEELSVDTDGLYLLTSPEGLVFMSTFEKFNNRTLWPLDKDAIDKIVSGRQFGNGPWLWSEFSFAQENMMQHRVQDPEGNIYTVHKQGIKFLPGWNIYYLHDNSMIFESIEKPMLKTVGSAVLALCLLFSVLAAFLHRFATKEIARRHAAEKLLRANEERLRSFFQTAGSIILVISPEHTILEANHAAGRFYGVKREEMVGRNYVADFLAEEARASVAADIAEVLQGKKTENFENQVVAADGEARTVLWNVNRLDHDGESAIGIIAIGQDITDRKKAQNELDTLFRAVEKAKKEWEGALDSIDDMIVIVDKSGVIKRLNKPFLKFTGDSYRDLLGKDWSETFNRYSLTTGQEFVPTEPQKIWHEKSQSWLVVTRFDLEKDKSKGPAGFIMTISDETALYRVITELDQRNYQIEENRVKLEKALEELSMIIRKVAEEKDFKVRFQTPDFPSCSDILNCGKVDCPCYGIEGDYCWMTSGTLCECAGEKVGARGLKESCLNCEVYRVASADPICRIGEEFNHMMGILEDKNAEVQEANTELDKRNHEIDENRAKLKLALDELGSLIQRVADEEDFGVRFENPNIQKCWAVMKCGKQDCPCFGKDPQRCWQVAGTYCGGEIQGEFAKKRDTCITCKNFELATKDPIYLIGEEFNNMMHILEHKNNELQSAYQELKQAQSQILQQEKMASVGQLAAGVAHEINNPMGFIGSNLTSLGKYSEKLTDFIRLQGEMLAKINDPETMTELKEVRKKLKLDFIVADMHDLIAESLDGADRVKKIVMGLKNFSRVDQAAQQMASMNECVESTLNVVWNELKYKCTVEKDYGDIPQIMCFPQQLNQVFMNLLVNGAQAIEEQGVITIKTREEDGFVLVSVTDTGCGIPPENQKRIFEPFFTTKDVGKGTGLGMSIAYDIIHKHGGDILIDSEVGKGSTFTVKLPVVRDNEETKSAG